MTPRLAASVFTLALLLGGIGSARAAQVLPLSRPEAEREALMSSSELKAYVENTGAANEQADAQHAKLFPRLSFDGTWRYQTVVPQLSLSSLGLPGGASLPFSSNTVYSLGPTLTYRLWDTFASLKEYEGLEKQTQARDEDRKNERLQLLLQVRTAYVRVQEAMAELRLVEDSLNLSRAQNRDIHTRFKAGASSYLDRVESDRDVLSYQIQFTQKQSELSSDLKDLLALTRGSARADPGLDLSHPGPPGVENVTLELELDPLRESLAEESRWKFAQPDELNPGIRSKELSAQSAELQAQSDRSTLYPIIDVSARTSLDYPNGPVLEQINQNTFTINLSMPLFEFSRTRHLAAEKMREADSDRYQKQQLRTDLDRDFDKAREILASLRYQRRLAIQDVRNSEEAARLYYAQYKAGKIYLIDVQTANNRALLSKVNAARIDAQILNQIDTLVALSGKEETP